MSREKTGTRSRILDCTWRLLETDPARAVRMADIAEAAGVSRQAVYLHFPNRADLLIATTRHIDAMNDVDARLAASRAAATGVERLDAYVEALGNYFPHVHAVLKALTALRDTDPAAAAAIADREAAMRHGCTAAIKALEHDNTLHPDHSPRQATDILWTLLSIHTWERYRHHCGWSQKRYVATMKGMARKVLVAGG